jgi:hypothetical protein
MQRLRPWLVLMLLVATHAQLMPARSVLAASSEPVKSATVQLQAAADQAGLALTTIVSTEQVTPTVRAPQPTIRSPLSPVTRTIFSQATDSVTVTLNLTPTRPAIPTLTVAPTTTAPVTTTLSPTTTNLTPTPAPAQPTTPTAPEGPIEGTIIANRTQAEVQFFVEGQTYALSPLRSQGLALPRETAVLNLFNCDTSATQTQSDCFWDPYLVNRDGFYEVISGQEAGKTVGLVLQEVGAPPVNQIWVQNRIGTQELVFHDSQEYTLAPSAVQEFAGQADVPVTLYVRSCLEVQDRKVCEWRPQNVDTGVYYALVEQATPGTLPGSRLQTVQLQPVVGSTQTGPIQNTPAQAQVVCTVLVPTLNVRSGPGLEYEIIEKVRGTESQPGSLLVIGRDVTGQWLAVDDRIADGGWVTGSASFVTCNGDVAALPETEIKDGRLVATPVPPTTATGATEAVAQSPSAPAADPEVSGEDETSPEAVEPAPSTPITTTVPEGQALLIVNNGFDQMVRFTLDQRYRVELGSSEFDLQPGQGIAIAVFPGQVAFSASTPWRGLAGNADFFIDSQQSRVLWLTFVPDPDGSGNWLLEY